MQFAYIHLEYSELKSYKKLIHNHLSPTTYMKIEDSNYALRNKDAEGPRLKSYGNQLDHRGQKKHPIQNRDTIDISYEFF